MICSDTTHRVGRKAAHQQTKRSKLDTARGDQGSAQHCTEGNGPGPRRQCMHWHLYEERLHLKAFTTCVGHFAGA